MLKRFFGTPPSNAPPPTPQSLLVQQPPLQPNRQAQYDMFYVPIARPRQQLYTAIHSNAKGQGQQQITIPEFSSP